MPPADQINDQTLLRAAIYGPARCKKTWWTLMAARLGFNVHLFDADGGWEILHQTDLTPEEKARINIIDITDTHEPIACYFLTMLIKQKRILWNERTKKFELIEKNVDFADPHYFIDMTKLGRSDVVAIDSWTAIVASLYMRYFLEKNVDLFEVDVDDDRNKRGEFGWAGALANWFLNYISKLPCHVVLIGHEHQWEKRATKTINGRKQEVVEDIRTQMVSTSGPNARDIIRRFGNALHFQLKLTGAVEINVQANPKEDAGSRFVAPGRYSWDELSFEALCKAGQVLLPDGNQRSEAVKFLPAGTEFTFEEIGLGNKAPASLIKGGNSAQAAQVAVEKPALKPSPFAKALGK